MNNSFKYKVFVVAIFVLLGKDSLGQIRDIVNIPDIANYKTLKCDFHMHTVFSDGHVWPTIRVHEAWRDGLDAIAITDHINYRDPRLKESAHLKMGDHNAPYNEAKLTAEKLGITLIKGVEINRDMPPGHFNVLFAKDINKLTDDDFFKALREAKKQGAYIQWNHPYYKQKGTPKWFEVHQRLYEEGLLDGIEVFNHDNLHDKAIEWANEKQLTVTADSDVHLLIDMIHDEDTHRPMTLVFAKDKSEASIREAMFARRTAAYFDDTVVGHQNHLKQLFEASVQVIDLPMIVETFSRYIQFKNNSDIDYELELIEKPKGTKMPKEMHLKSNKITLQTMQLYNDKVVQADSLKAKYQVTNLKSISGEPVIVEFTFFKKEPVKEIKIQRVKYPKVTIE